MTVNRKILCANFIIELGKSIQENNHGYTYLCGNLEGFNPYFTIEDAEGYRVYIQLNMYWWRGVDVSIKYKPSKKNGSGIQYREAVEFDSTLITRAIDEALTEARRYPRNEQKPSCNGKYLIG